MNAHPFERSNWNLIVFSLAFGHDLKAKDRGEGAEVNTHAAGKHSGTPEKPRRVKAKVRCSSAPGTTGRVLPHVFHTALLAHLLRYCDSHVGKKCPFSQYM